MGRKRQEQVTGKTYEERVRLAQSLPKRIIGSIRGFFKSNKKFYANTRRDGISRQRRGMIDDEK